MDSENSNKGWFSNFFPSSYTQQEVITDGKKSIPTKYIRTSEMTGKIEMSLAHKTTTSWTPSVSQSFFLENSSTMLTNVCTFKSLVVTLPPSTLMFFPFATCETTNVGNVYTKGKLTFTTSYGPDVSGFISTDAQNRNYIITLDAPTPSEPGTYVLTLKTT